MNVRAPQKRALGLLLMAAIALSPLRIAAQADAAAPPAFGNPEQSASPDSAASGPPQAALDHYLRGRRWYLAGRYRDALVELKAALEIDRRSPDLLYNVARVYENLAEYDQAIAYYQRYLALLPTEAVEERDRTEKTIRRLQGAKHEVTPARGDTAPQPVPASYGRADLAFWLTGAAALGLLAGGGVTGYLALKKRGEVAEFVAGPDGAIAKRNKLASDTERLALISDGLTIGGAVALTTAALLFILRERDPAEATSVTPKLALQVDAQRALIGLHGQF